MTHQRLLCSVVLFASIQLPAAAGVFMETTERNAKTGGEKPATTIRVQDGKMRVDNGANSNAVIFRDANLYMIDNQRKSYMLLDSATVQRMSGAMNDMMAQMRKQLEQMPPEQRAAMENMMKQNGMTLPGASAKPPVYDAKATGAADKAAGRDCKVWDITRDGVLWQQVCVVPYGSLPGQEEFKAVSKQMRGLTEKLGDVAKQFESDPLQNSALQEKLNGVPFIMRRYRDGVLQPESIVMKTWTTQSIEAGKFEIPAGYTKQEMPSMPGRPPGNPNSNPTKGPPQVVPPVNGR